MLNLTGLLYQHLIENHIPLLAEYNGMLDDKPRSPKPEQSFVIPKSSSTKPHYHKSCLWYSYTILSYFLLVWTELHLSSGFSVSKGTFSSNTVAIWQSVPLFFAFGNYPLFTKKVNCRQQSCDELLKTQFSISNLTRIAI